jgi:mannose-6-phosphate isomerase-like protein (cupin superfamily)
MNCMPIAAGTEITKYNEGRKFRASRVEGCRQRCRAGARFHSQEHHMDKVNLEQKFSLFSEHYSPRIVGEINDTYVKVVKLQGEFVWHHHDEEDELFFVVKGELRMKFRENGAEREVTIGPGEFVIVPHGVEHLPSADEETHIMLLEPKSTLNTGNVRNERTLAELQRI